MRPSPWNGGGILKEGRGRSGYVVEPQSFLLDMTNDV